MAENREPADNERRLMEDELRSLKVDYQAEIAAADERRRAKLAKARDMGFGVVEMANLSGYGREAVRQYLNPEARAAHNRRRTKAGRTGSGAAEDN